MARRLTILGSTGSIGKSALKIVRACPGEFEIAGLAAHSNVDELSRQIAEFNPRRVALADETAAKQLQQAHSGLKVGAGPESLVDLAAEEVDIVLCGIVGAAGLRSVLGAIEGGNRVALANKEPMVMAGELIMSKAREQGVEVLPVDSEHNAIFQLLEGRKREDIHRVYLTASGGPFYRQTREALREITPEQAVRHPTWDMGAKISVDSATLMNKGLEVIEAMWLFDLPLDLIEVIIHPQSAVHGLVEFKDGHILAHLGVTDMMLPIQFALMWPKRVESSLARLDLTAMGELSFAAPDFSEFPCLGHAMEAARKGGTAGAILNAANEAAVEAFRQGRIPFLSIAQVVGEVMESSHYSPEYTLDSVLDIDTETRRNAEGIIQAVGVKSS